MKEPLNLYLDKEEKDLLKKYAQKAGLSVSKYIMYLFYSAQETEQDMEKEEPSIDKGKESGHGKFNLEIGDIIYDDESDESIDTNTGEVCFE